MVEPKIDLCDFELPNSSGLTRCVRWRDHGGKHVVAGIAPSACTFYEVAWDERSAPAVAHADFQGAPTREEAAAVYEFLLIRREGTRR